MVLEALDQVPEAIAAYRKAQPWPAGSDLPQRMGNLLLRVGEAAAAEGILREAAEDLEKEAIGS